MFAPGASGVTFKDTVPVRPPITRSDSDESKTSAWGRILQMNPNPLKADNEDKNVADPAALDVLSPNFTNTYDVYDEKKLERRAKRDRKALTQKVRRRLREELREAAGRERNMFWTNVMWVYCLQWHLCCRLGFMRFWMWLALLSVIATAVMIAPMSYAMNEMDLSWCRFMSNSTLAKYQPQWRS
ncbi:unnamed protein product [Cylicocyclus nassatus]|uniref:Uncharacterized protein n=1 Tax=Cylicocyclus nassatus TaxID=53992 RepID=A0AA36MEX3_CYLNA|nr:unnamed protein product [Cylicocyclus nassatus]